VQPAQYRGQDYESDRRYRPPYLRGPARDYDRERYGGPSGERPRALPPYGAPGREPLADGQIWAIARSRVPGRILQARLHGVVYSFRILSNRGGVVDLDVDRYSGRVLSVRGGP
jgi:hypothetical protein